MSRSSSNYNNRSKTQAGKPAKGLRGEIVPVQFSYFEGTQYIRAEEYVNYTPVVTSGTPYRYIIDPESVLPLGLSLNEFNGVINGTPSLTNEGIEQNVDIIAKGPRTTTTSNLSFNVGQVPSFTYGFSSQNIADGSTYSFGPTTSGTSLTFSVGSGNLPSGLSLNTSNGTIAGTVLTNVTGTYNSIIQAVNPWGTGTTSISFEGSGIWPPPLTTMSRKLEWLVGYSNMYTGIDKTGPVTYGQDIQYIENYVSPGSGDLLYRDGPKLNYLENDGDGNPTILYPEGTTPIMDYSTNVFNIPVEVNNTLMMVFRAAPNSSAGTFRGPYSSGIWLGPRTLTIGGSVTGPNELTYNISDGRLGGVTSIDNGIHILTIKVTDTDERLYFDSLDITTNNSYNGVGGISGMGLQTNSNSDNMYLYGVVLFDLWDEDEWADSVDRLNTIYGQQNSLLTDLKSFYPLDEATASSNYDDIHSTYDMTPSTPAPAVVAGRLGNAKHGNAAGKTASTTHYTFNPSSTYYWSTWINRLGSNNTHDIFGIYSNTNPILDVQVGNTYSGQPDTSSSGLVTINLYSGTASNSIGSFTSTGNIPVSGYHLLEAFYHGGSKQLGIAIDNSSWESGAFSFLPSMPSNTTYGLFRNAVNSNNAPNHYIDEFMFRSGSLPGNFDRAGLYNTGAGIEYPFGNATPAGLTYSNNQQNIASGYQLQTMIPSLELGTAQAYSIDASTTDQLPSGIVLNSANGYISGVALEVTPFVDVTVRATNTSLSEYTTTTVHIAVRQEGNLEFLT